MVDASAIRAHMPVIGSDGEHVGTVDSVEGDRIKLTRNDAPDGQHHYIPFAEIARVDDRVYLSVPAAAALAGGTAVGESSATNPLPPVKNRAVAGAMPRKNFYLPWVVGAVGIVLLLLLFRGCVKERQDAAAPLTQTAQTTTVTTTPAVAIEAVTLPNGQRVEVEPNTLTYDLQRYLASDEARPRTFQFDRLNFDTGSAAIRPSDQLTVDALGQILVAYPATRVRLVGYADARGTASANAELGERRAIAVHDALVAKGVPEASIEAGSGGEGAPETTNATAAGQAENRRTELIVLAK